MATYNKFDNYSLALATGKYNFATDSLLIALTTVIPVRTNVKTADITQISYTNLSSRALTIGSSADVAGVFTLKINNLVLTASGGSVAGYQYVVVLDSTAVNNELICWFDLGAVQTLNNGDSGTVTFDQTNGLFSIT